MTEPYSDQKPLSFYQKVIASIVDGHAWLKHVAERGDFPAIRNKKHFRECIENFLDDQDTKGIQGLGDNRIFIYNAKHHIVMHLSGGGLTGDGIK